ncbi:MAG: hypothetical protein K0Q49_170 [Haloplasmataceae bacterium]|jgi:hypothetical protein|nr:hypothetical protein [Haloplasmataceae bacterium]
MELTLNKYRMMDLTFFSILAVIAEVISIVALREFSGAGFYLSFSVMIAIISIIRWGAIGSVVYIASGIPMIFISSEEILTGLLLFPLANTFISLSTIIFLFIKREDIIKNRLLFLTYQVLVFVCISFGKGIASYIIDGNFINVLYSYFVSQLFCILITCLFLTSISKKEGLVVNMEKYILSVRVEEGKNDISR